MAQVIFRVRYNGHGFTVTNLKTGIRRMIARDLSVNLLDQTPMAVREAAGLPDDTEVTYGGQDSRGTLHVVEGLAQAGTAALTLAPWGTR